jgi:hypothetical protein
MAMKHKHGYNFETQSTTKQQEMLNEKLTNKQQ